MVGSGIPKKLGPDTDNETTPPGYVTHYVWPVAYTNDFTSRDRERLARQNEDPKKKQPFWRKLDRGHGRFPRQ